tara:strand:- start:554 stop:706 length:153 start_codon:yes stop_codon:yes gene_type:complete
MSCTFKPEISKISKEIVKRKYSSKSTTPTKKSEGANLTDDEAVSNKHSPN